MKKRALFATLLLADKVAIPFEYLALPSHLSEFNPAQKANRLHGVVDAKGETFENQAELTIAKPAYLFTNPTWHSGFVK